MANTKPQPGEVWYAEFGMVEKGRPVLVLYYPHPDDARSLTIVAPLTSQIRGFRGELDLGHPQWLPKPSAVNVQGLASIDRNKLSKKFGKLTDEQMDDVKNAIRDLLNL